MFSLFGFLSEKTTHKPISRPRRLCTFTANHRDEKEMKKKDIFFCVFSVFWVFFVDFVVLVMFLVFLHEAFFGNDDMSLKSPKYSQISLKC